MKIAVFFTFDYSLQTWNSSGMLDREFQIYTEIKRKFGVDFIFFTYGNEVDLELGNVYKDFEIYPLYTRINFSKNRLFRFIKSLFLPILFRKEIKGVDILHQHQMLGVWVAIISKIFYRKPLLLRTGYDMENFAKLNNKSAFVVNAYRVLRFLSIKSSNLFTVSNLHDFERFQKYYKNEKASELLIRKNWVKVLPKSKQLKERHLNKILSIGRLENQKNFELLINEFKDTEDELSLDIIGNGSSENKLVDLATSNNVKVNFLGTYTYEKLIEIYHDYAFYVSTSSFEGNPKTILEAMGSGCVVIASDIPNHKELIDNDVNGILFSLRRPNLKEVITKLRKDTNNLKKLSLTAKQKVLEDNNINDLATLMHEDYKRLMNYIPKK